MTQNPERLFQEITLFIERSDAKLKAGAFAEMKGLDAKVASLCSEALELSGEQRKQYADKLQQVLQALHELQKKLIAARDDVGQQISTSTVHRKANIAYQKTENSDKK